MNLRRRKIARLLFALYCAGMLILLLGRKPDPVLGSYLQTMRGHLNLVPLRTIRHMHFLLTRPQWQRFAAINIYGNVGMFLPLGFALPKAFPSLDRLWKTLLVSAGLVLCVELLQLVLLVGQCDIDDLILNLLGSAMGFGLHRLCQNSGQ